MNCSVTKYNNIMLYNHWTALVDWTGGLDWWTGLVDWTGGLTLKKKNYGF